MGKLEDPRTIGGVEGVFSRAVAIKTIVCIRNGPCRVRARGGEKQESENRE